MRNLDDILDLITGNLTKDQKTKVLSDIYNDPDGEDLYKKAKTTWALMSSSREMSDYRIEQSYQKLNKRIAFASHKRITYSFYLKYAAAIILFFSFSTLMYYWGKRDNGSSLATLYYTSVIAEKGQISKVILPDSSVVWLNSETILSYDNYYGRKNRNLKLSGQAFLDVRKNKQLPLIVNSGDLMVKVLGTRFDVKAYPGDKEIKVSLESGKVELLNTTNKSFKYKLEPGQRANYNTKDNSIDIDSIKNRIAMDWKEGVLQFSNTPMEEVIKVLKRKYDVDIEVTDSRVYRSVFNATFKNESLSEILAYIQFSCHINYQIIKENSKTKVILN